MRELTEAEIALVINALNLQCDQQVINGAPKEDLIATALLINLFATEIYEKDEWAALVVQSKEYKDKFKTNMSFADVVGRLNTAQG